MGIYFILQNFIKNSDNNLFNQINLIDLSNLINIIREKTKKKIKPYLYPTQVVKQRIQKRIEK